MKNKYGDKVSDGNGKVIEELNADFGLIAFKPDERGEHTAELILSDGSILPRLVHVAIGRVITGGFVTIDDERTGADEFEVVDYQICIDPRIVAAICIATGVSREGEENGYQEGKDPYEAAKTLGVINAPPMDEARKILEVIGVPSHPYHW